MNSAYSFKTLIGRITLADNGESLIGLHFHSDRQTQYPQARWQETMLLKQAARELEEYLTGRRQMFDLPLTLCGSVFQQQVWQALLSISYGETRSYSQIAAQIGCPNGSRAVGMANNRNPIPIIIPCHRVIGANGSLVGYGGGLRLKKFLLDIEQKNKGKIR